MDGYVKLWDMKSREGSGLVMKSLVHYGVPSQPPRGKASSSSSSSATTGMAVSCMSMALEERGSGGISYIVTAGADSAVCLLDARRNFSIVERWEHHRIGVYSMCVIGGDCVMTGDGSGGMLCYDIRSGVKYGLGASATYFAT